jgi:hypothetical protein
MVLGGVVVLVVVVEFESGGAEPLGVNASAAAPAMITPDEHAAATSFQVIRMNSVPGPIRSGPASYPRATTSRSSIAYFAHFPLGGHVVWSCSSSPAAGLPVTGSARLASTTKPGCPSDR